MAPCSRAAAYGSSQLRNHVDLALGKSERQPRRKVVRRALSAHVLNFADCLLGMYLLPELNLYRDNTIKRTVLDSASSKSRLKTGVNRNATLSA